MTEHRWNFCLSGKGNLISLNLCLNSELDFWLLLWWWFTLTCVQLFNPIDGSTPSLLPHPSVSPRVCSNSYPLSRWCHPTISFSLFTDCWWQLQIIWQGRAIYVKARYLNSWSSLRRPIQSVFGNLIEAVGKCKHFSSSAAERVKYRPGAVGGHWHLCGKNLLQSNQQKKMLMQKWKMKNC